MALLNTAAVGVVYFLAGNRAVYLVGMCFLRNKMKALTSKVVLWASGIARTPCSFMVIYVYQSSLE